MVNRRRTARSAAPPDVEFVALADRAEVINGKLYLMGGCWDRIQLNSFPAVYQLGIAARVLLPAGDSRDEHVLQLELLGPEGTSLNPRAVQFIRQGEPPNGPASALFGLMAVAVFPEPGDYVLIGRVDGVAAKEAAFTVAAPP